MTARHACTPSKPKPWWCRWTTVSHPKPLSGGSRRRLGGDLLAADNADRFDADGSKLAVCG